MNKYKLGALLFAAFIAGDWEAVIRGNHHWRKKLSELKRSNSLLKMKLTLANDVITAMDDPDVTYEDMAEKFKPDLEFIDLIEKQF